MTREALNHLAGRVLDAAFAVHTLLGPGLLESAYKACLQHELTLRDLRCEQEVPVPVVYKGKKLGEVGYRIDLLIQGELIVDQSGRGNCTGTPSPTTKLFKDGGQTPGSADQFQCREPSRWDQQTCEQSLRTRSAQSLRRVRCAHRGNFAYSAFVTQEVQDAHLP